MGKRARIPRKLKKKLKKQGLYSEGISWVHCVKCQKKANGYGYDMLFCFWCS